MNVPLAPEPMSAVDQAWFEMDAPHSPMVVAAVMEFAGVANPQALGDELVSRLLSVARFRQHVRERGGRREWVEEPLRPGYHLRVRPLPRQDPDVALRAAIARELEQDLDRGRPLWRIVLFPRPRRHATLLFRAHHAIADGIALMQLLLHFSDGPHAPLPDAGHPRAPHGPLAGVIAGLEGLNRLMERASSEIVEDLLHPGRLSHQLEEARDSFRAAARVAALPDDNPPPLRAPLGGHRAVAWDHSIRLAAVRRVARDQHVTVNDVFLTALAGAFGRSLRRHGPVRESQNLRVSVPVNLRRPGDGAEGNRFGLVLLDLPVGLEGWHARLDVIADRMAALKRSPEPRAVLGALWAAGHLPAAAERTLVDFVGHKAAAVVSNLPGPAEPLRFVGATLRSAVFWPPQSAGIGIGVSLLSYAGTVSVGVSADTAQLAEPERLVQDFLLEFEAMRGRTRA